MAKMRGLIYNQDSTDFFYHYAIVDGVEGGALLDQYLDLIADAGVGIFVCNTNARKTNYRSEVWESFWDGYDPSGSDDQPFFKSVPLEGLAGYRKLIHSMWALHDQGVDYPARVSACCRRRGMSPWISLRMNDVHFNDKIDHPFHGEFWRDPSRWREGSMPYFVRALDYGQTAVRDLYRTLIVETLERYDVDGLELDFMREPYLFREGQEQAGAAVLREWLGEMRGLVQESAKRRGHDIALGVRVPSRLEVAQGWGLEAVAWAEEGLVDLVVATPRWATLEYDMPVAQWREALAGTAASFAGGIEINYWPSSTLPVHHVTPEQAVGAATAVLAGGADAVYLFNYFPSIIGGTGWNRELYLSTLQAMRSLDTLASLPRRHGVTYRDITGPGEQYTPPLPAQGKSLACELPTGPKPREGAPVTVELTLTQPVTATPTLTVNGVAAQYDSRQGEGPVVLSYSLPPTALTDRERNHVVITSPEAMTVADLEIAIG